MMRLPAVMLGFAVLTSPSPALCQDALRVAPQAVAVEYEDARIRVARLTIGSNETTPMRDWMARVVVLLTPNDVRIEHADGTARTTHAEAGRVVWSEPVRRAVTNLAGTPIENIVLELKGAAAPARAVTGPPSLPPAEYLDEPRHHWLFENQYVRVYEVRIPPGETTDFHRHAYDAVYVFVSGGLVASQERGEPWGQAERIVPHTVKFTADSKKPHTHRVRNDGTAEYRLVAVQLLP